MSEVVFPDWSQATRLGEVKVTVLEAIGPLTEPYATNHRDGPVYASPGQYLIRRADDPNAVTAVDSLDGYGVLAEPDATGGEPGVARIVGDPLVLEGADAAAFIAALAAGGLNEVGPFAGHVGGPAVDIAEIDPADGITGEDAASETPTDDAPLLEEKPRPTRKKVGA